VKKHRWLVATWLVLACAAGASAQEYPARPVKILVPYAAGGVPDVLARTLAQRLSESLSQNFLIENKPGAGGIPAVVAAARSPADGYTLLIGDVSQTAINPHVFKDIPYDTLRDFAPISVLANAPVYVAISAATRIGSFAELVAYTRANPGRLSYGSAGIGSFHHIAVESMKAALGMDLVHVPYKGSGQSVPAFLAGEVPIVITALPLLGPHVQSGRVKLLAITSGARSPQTPDVPSVADFIPGYHFLAEIGLLAPAETPGAVVARLSAESAKAMKRPETIARFTALGLEPVGSTAEAFTAVIRSNHERYGRAVKISGASQAN
jgi:tripartite-type tricarboxylate transporter receptor subunit TctC